MIATFVILFIIICILGAFNGMMFLLLFPVMIILFIISAIIHGRSNNYVKGVKQKEDEDNTLEEHVMFEEFTDHHK